ncbi:MAG: hypothetical protein KAI83_01995 [Thiomargarita sp.]|nr:hypothetical protein [Thiomargarita sp.]
MIVRKPVALHGTAVHTRDIKPGKDYDWYVKAGDLQLFDKMDEIYRIALRDVEGDAPKLAIIIDGQRIGLLIGDLPSQRVDHSQRVIHDTLYLEFDREYHRTVLHTAAVLLLCPKKTYKPHEQHFTQYAEELFLRHSQEKELIFKTATLPVVSQQPNFNLPLIRQEKIALFSDLINRNRCARYLLYFTERENIRFSFVSTGRLNLEKCEQVAEKSDECLLLTLSSEVPQEINLKKGKSSRFGI